MRRILFQLIAAILPGLILTACSSNVVVVVNRTPVTQADLADAVAIANMSFDPALRNTAEHQQRVSQQMLDMLIDGILVEQELTSTKTLPSDADITDALDAEKASYSEASFRDELAARQIAYDTWTTLRRRQILIDTYRGHLRAALPAPAASDIKSYYAAHRDEFAEPATVHVRHLITDNQETAERLHAQLTQGGNFAYLAAEHSIAPEAANGGDLGWISAGGYPAAFNVCFTMDVGQLSAVVPSEYGYHIFKIVAKRPARTPSLADATPRITERLQSQQLEITYANAVAALRAKAAIDRKPVPLVAGTSAGVSP